MDDERREVRVAESFFEQLDRQVRAERGPNGEASSTDFLALELFEIVDTFARRFEDLPPVDVGATRVYLGHSVLFNAVAVYGVLVGDIVEIIGITVDH